MIIRIVKMTFQEENIPTFEALFDRYKEEIRNQEGCLHLKLLQDKANPRIFFTYSLWQDEDFLNQYRNSALFAEVWPATKTLFKDKAEAWTVNEKVVLP
jgi:quinol monooxygenase YgiN